MGESMSVKNFIKNDKKFRDFIDKYIPDETQINTIRFYDNDQVPLIPNKLEKNSFILGIASEYLFIVAINKNVNENNQISFDDLNSDKGLMILEKCCTNDKLLNDIKSRYSEIKTYLKWESFYSNLEINHDLSPSDIYSKDMLDEFKRLLKKELSLESNEYDFYFNLDDLCQYAIFCAHLETIYKSGKIPIDLYTTFFEYDTEMIEELKEILKLFINVFIFSIDDSADGGSIVNYNSEIIFHPKCKNLFYAFHGFEIDMILDGNIVDFKSSEKIQKSDWAQLLTYIIFWTFQNKKPFQGFIYLSRYGIIKQIDPNYIISLWENEDFINDFLEILKYLKLI